MVGAGEFPGHRAGPWSRRDHGFPPRRRGLSSPPPWHASPRGAWRRSSPTPGAHAEEDMQPAALRLMRSQLRDEQRIRIRTTIFVHRRCPYQRRVGESHQARDSDGGCSRCSDQNGIRWRFGDSVDHRIQFRHLIGAKLSFAGHDACHLKFCGGNAHNICPGWMPEQPRTMDLVEGSAVRGFFREQCLTCNLLVRNLHWWF